MRFYHWRAMNLSIFLVLLVFVVSVFVMIFSKDSYINAELAAYQKTLREPWIHRVVALKYDFI